MLHLVGFPTVGDDGEWLVRCPAQQVQDWLTTRWGIVPRPPAFVKSAIACPERARYAPADEAISFLGGHFAFVNVGARREVA